MGNASLFMATPYATARPSMPRKGTSPRRHLVLLLRGVPDLLRNAVPVAHIIGREDADPVRYQAGPPALVSGHQRVFGQDLHQVAPPQAELVVRRRLVVEHRGPEARLCGRRIRRDADAITRSRPAENICLGFFRRGNARLGTHGVVQGQKKGIRSGHETYLQHCPPQRKNNEEEEEEEEECYIEK
ncbi:hypothetical protein EYF80_043306 [Liparis tanakae]|uniref:Uncharacterized protein n=1 Tax=Liparis tanakae TaxID=230148 RepID=A0A4Z2FYW1_9TELE|nr:hypothetical protein EYF80_043306 [Liparis tanakae]